MCEPADALQILKEIPFRVAALEKVVPHGSYELALVRSVYVAVKQDIEWAIKQIEAERKRKA